jgi:hypothetical protein
MEISVDGYTIKYEVVYYHVIVKTSVGMSWLCHKRFSQILAFKETLTKHVSGALPLIPDKKLKLFFDHTDTAFVLFRQFSLHEFFQELLLHHPRLQHTTEFHQFITSDRMS